MKYKVWDKINNCWTPNVTVDHAGVLYWTFGFELMMISNPENYEVFWEIVHRGVRAFVGDVVDYTLFIPGSQPKYAERGVVDLGDKGLTVNGWDIHRIKITKVLGHSKDLQWT